jgi:two-component system phosphate regulon sensor histidine kinase PhoR
MIRSPFFWKLFGGFTLVALLGIVVTGQLVSRWLETDLEASIREDLGREALLIRELARPALAGGDAASLQRQIARIAPGTETRLTVIREDGVVLAESDEDPATMDNHASRPEVAEARRSGRGSAVRFSRTIAATMVYVAVAVDQGGVRIGYTRAGLPVAAVASRLDGLRDIVVVAGVVATLLALGAGFWIASRVTGRLAVLTGAAERLASGDVSVRIPTGANERDEIGRLAGAFSVMTRALAERVATVEDDRRTLRAVLGSMAEGVLAVDADMSVLHMNDTAATLFGADVVRSVGEPIWEVARVAGVGEAVEETLAAGGQVQRELSVDVAGATRTLELLASPLRDGEGRVAGAVVVLHDQTDLRRLETVRSDFVANVSHELKTPITAIRGLIETIVDDREMPDETRDRFLSKIQNQSIRLSLLVTDLLTLARLESAAGLPDLEPIDLRTVVNTSVDHFRVDAADRGLTLEVEVPSDRVDVLGDQDALGLVVNNLVDNALKYTPEGGRVSVALRTDDGAAEIAVRDTGVGIAREHHDRVFERFYRVDKARSRELGGTGLGLSIVKHVCKAHGGSVTVESAPAAGSVFAVRLPRRET